MNNIDKLDKIAESVMGRTLCALADAAAMPVRSFIQHFRSEFLEKITDE